MRGIVEAVGDRANVRKHLLTCGVLALLLGFLWLVTATVITTQPIHAQEGGPTQVFSGNLNVGHGAWYRLPDLKKGEVLFAYLGGTSGNLDPFLAVLDHTYEHGALQKEFYARFEEAVAGGSEPVEAVSDVAGELVLAWDDDSGEGYDAALEFEVPVDGDYYVLAIDSLTKDTFGDYSLIVGIDAPDVLNGVGSPGDSVIAILDRKTSSIKRSVQEITGTLTLEAPDAYYELENVDIGDDLYVYAEGTSNDLMPRLILHDYGDKMLRTANLFGDSITTTLSYRFTDDSKNNTLQVFGHDYMASTGVISGSYRLLVGTNTPEVLSGQAEPEGPSVVKRPTIVDIGLKLDQITNVDQVAENFGAVVSLMMKWQDPNLAFSPDSCQCTQQVFTGDGFAKFADENDIVWPQFTVFNQQGNRWVQNRNVVVQPDGSVTYFERFTTDLQAPDFDFVRFPFDVQSLFIRIVSLYTNDVLEFVDSPELTAIGTQLGEEEWHVVDSHTEVDTYNKVRSRFSLAFDVRRHLNFYIFRILLPIMLIIIVSWFTFFLKDYGKRIDVTSANLLLFIAFNFTISGELPRLGYLTFMDSILIMTFVISALTIVFNVYLKHMEQAQKGRLIAFVRFADNLMIWLYPLAYVLGAAALARVFLLD